jgi:hypothetical protein
LGTSADRSGIAAENRYPIVTSNSGKVYAQTRSKTLEWRRIADLANLQNHAKQIVACDFFTVVTASFNVLYVFIVMEHASRRIVYFNVTDHPTAGWTIQQFREAFPSQHE